MPTRFLTSSFLALVVALAATLAACDAPTTPSDGRAGLQVERKGLLPIIDSVEPEQPAPGDEVTLRGYFHKLRKDDGLFVSFNGYDSRHVTLVSDNELKAVVPAGATSGNVVVVMGESVSKGVFIKVRDKQKKEKWRVSFRSGV